MSLSRRRALVALGAMGALALGIAVIPQWRRLSTGGRVLDLGALARALVPLSRDERASLGRAILELEKDRRHELELAAASDGRVRPRDGLLVGPKNVDALIEDFRGYARSDFAKGRVMLVDRWYLSRTQADVLAAAAKASADARAQGQIGAAS